MATSAAPDFVVFGAGPVGLAAAAVLAKRGFNVVVYEALPAIPTDITNSYPIGINPRALKCLEMIDPKLKSEAISRGMLIDAWDIYGGESRVAHLESKVVFGTTRGDVNAMLYEYCCTHCPSIFIMFNHRVTALDLKTNLATFSDGSQVNLGGTRIIGCDGVNSVVRSSMLQFTAGFTSTVTPWTKRFRVLFSPPVDSITTDLDPGVHYILNGIYCATIKNSSGVIYWSVVCGVGQDLSAAEQSLLSSENASSENVSALRKFLARMAPKCLSLFPDDSEFERFFARRMFGGSVVSVSALNDGEHTLLMGDACHSVLPPTGEGINSGLEDVSLLSVLLASEGTASSLFAEFNTRRAKDVQALGRIARYLNENMVMKGPEAAARLGFMIGQSILQSMGVYGPGYEDLTFGPSANEMRPYGEIIDMWDSRKKILLPCCRCCCYPCFPQWYCSLLFCGCCSQVAQES